MHFYRSSKDQMTRLLNQGERRFRESSYHILNKWSLKLSIRTTLLHWVSCFRTSKEGTQNCHLLISKSIINWMYFLKIEHLMTLSTMVRIRWQSIVSWVGFHLELNQVVGSLNRKERSTGNKSQHFRNPSRRRRGTLSTVSNHWRSSRWKHKNRRKKRTLIKSSRCLMKRERNRE